MIDIWGRQNHPLQAAVGCVPYAKKIIHIERSFNMIYSHEVEMMCPVAQGAKWVQAKEIKDISGFTHGVGWCAPQQGACKLSLNVKEGVIQEALVETIGCSGMTHSAAMASEILPGKTILEALNTDLVCDAINTAMRELFLQIRKNTERIFRRRTCDRCRTGRPWKRAPLSGRYYVWYTCKRSSLP